MFLAALFAPFLFWQQSTFEVARIDFEGLQRFQPAAVLATLGIEKGGKASTAHFDAACQKLVQTGLFEGCNWKYAPVAGSSGVSLTFALQEAPASQSVRLTIPGVDEKQLWEWPRTNEPLAQPTMPASDLATEFFTAAIQRFLKKKAVFSVDTNLNTKETTLVFRPADLPTVETVRFEGAEAIPATTLEKVLNPVARGTGFTEYDIQQLLDLNIRPMYDNLGHLNVRFPSVKAEGGAVTVAVEEGPVYKLGAIQVTGGPAVALPAGQTAEWSRILAEADKANAELRNQGHLNAAYDIKKDLKNDVVDLAIRFRPGPRFTFNALQLRGLNVPQEVNIRKAWKLEKGTPMNESMVAEFLKAAFGKLGSEYQGVAHQSDPVGPSAVDVVITFKR